MSTPKPCFLTSDRLKVSMCENLYKNQRVFGQLDCLRIFSCNMRSSHFQLMKPIADIEFINRYRIYLNRPETQRFQMINNTKLREVNILTSFPLRQWQVIVNGRLTIATCRLLGYDWLWVNKPNTNTILRQQNSVDFPLTSGKLARRNNFNVSCMLGYTAYIGAYVRMKVEEKEHKLCQLFNFIYFDRHYMREKCWLHPTFT